MQVPPPTMESNQDAKEFLRKICVNPKV